MKTPLWVPSDAVKHRANITRFIDMVNRRWGLEIQSYPELYAWSVEHIPEFWAAMWDFGGIIASRGYRQVVDDLTRFPGARWFDGARLNFAENLLRYRDAHLAFIFRGETQASAQMTYAELCDAVARLAASLRDLGIRPGDRVAAYMPNLIETAVAMLAATSVGATWASCATDLGPQAALDRLGQIEPRVLFTADGYYYKGTLFDTRGNAASVARGIP
ncbi:MAG: AMP-binding protein, partial [Peptococcaceae bacterium]|nr:AMP-binding protein [Peptococcaceae bacterium]